MQLEDCVLITECRNEQQTQFAAADVEMAEIQLFDCCTKKCSALQPLAPKSLFFVNTTPKQGLF